jgi:hypothetical protein
VPDGDDDVLYIGPDDDPDRYAVGEACGAGSEGVLYKAALTTSSGTRLDVAVKMLHPKYLGRIAEWQRRWTEQVELLRSLQAPGVVPVRDGFLGALPHRAGTADPAGTRTLYLVMNWVDGQSLDRWLDTHLDASAADKLQLLLPVGAALDLMHSGAATGGVPIIHRDLKPANILVTSTGRSVLVDFGLVRTLPSGSDSSGVAGTLGYIAPETLDDGAYSPATDRYAFGAIAYFLLAGEEPDPDPPADVLRAKLGRAVPGQADVVDHVRAMLSSDPDTRPHPLANWCAQLRNSSLGLDDQADVLAPVAPARQRKRSAMPLARPAPVERRRPPLILAAAGFVLAAGAIVTAIVLARSPSGAEKQKGTAIGTSVQASTTTAPPAVVRHFGIGTPVAAERVTPRDFRPIAALTFSTGWKSLRAETARIADFGLAQAKNRTLSFINVSEVVRAASTQWNNSDLTRADVSALTGDVVAWLRGNERLNVGPERVENGARVVNVTVRAGAGYPAIGITQGPAVRLFRLDDTNRCFGLVEGNTNQLWIYKAGRDTVVAAIEARAADYPAFAPEAAKLLTSLVLTAAS